MNLSNRNIYFVTLSIQNWVPIFHDLPETHFIILDSLKYLNENEDVLIYGFVIMRDHIHFIWECPDRYTNDEVVVMFKKYTGLKIVKYLKNLDTDHIHIFNSDRQDRSHKIWKIRGGALQIFSKQVFLQKLEYIHRNPTKGEYKVVDLPEEYLFSSAKAYLDGVVNFSFLRLMS